MTSYRRTIIAIILFLAAFGVSWWLATSSDSSSSQMENDPLAFVPVVVMLQTIPHGYVITQDIVALDFRLIDTIPPSALTDIEDVVGHPARFDLYQGLTLTAEMLGPLEYKALMATQPITFGKALTPDIVQLVSLPYDSDELRTNTIIYNKNRPLSSSDLIASQDILANTIITWSMVNFDPFYIPDDPYLSMKNELDQSARLANEQEGLSSNSTVDNSLSLFPEAQKRFIARFALLDYFSALMLGALSMTLLMGQIKKRQPPSKTDSIHSQTTKEQ